jgi:hypothetical protein
MDAPLLHRRAGAIGFLFGILSLPLHFLLTAQQSVDLASVVVAIIGAIYVGYALQQGNIRQSVVEIIVASLFFAIALAGMWWNPWIIPIGYVLHGLWDAIHHFHGDDLAPVPLWYPSFCAVYDWIYAAGLAIIWLRILPG